MRCGFITMFERDEAGSRFLDVLREMGRYGFYPYHPRSGSMVTWNGDADGVHKCRVVPRDILHHFRTSGRTGFALWLTPVEYVWVTMKRVGADVIATRLSIDTLSAPYVSRAIHAGQRYFLGEMGISQNMVGMVIDTAGATEGYDWSRFFLTVEDDPRYIERLPGALPDVVGLCAALDGRYGSFFTGWRRSPIGSHVLYKGEEGALSSWVDAVVLDMIEKDFLRGDLERLRSHRCPGCGGTLAYSIYKGDYSPDAPPGRRYRSGMTISCASERRMLSHFDGFCPAWAEDVEDWAAFSRNIANSDS